MYAGGYWGDEIREKVKEAIERILRSKENDPDVLKEELQRLRNLKSAIEDQIIALEAKLAKIQ